MLELQEVVDYLIAKQIRKLSELSEALATLLEKFRIWRYRTAKVHLFTKGLVYGWLFVLRHNIFFFFLTESFKLLGPVFILM